MKRIAAMLLIIAALFAPCGCKKTEKPVVNPFEEYGGRRIDPRTPVVSL